MLRGKKEKSEVPGKAGAKDACNTAFSGRWIRTEVTTSLGGGTERDFQAEKPVSSHVTISISRER